MQYSQEHLKTMVYAKFGGQTECIMGNWKIENIKTFLSKLNYFFREVMKQCVYTIAIYRLKTVQFNSKVNVRFINMIFSFFKFILTIPRYFSSFLMSVV